MNDLLFPNQPGSWILDFEFEGSSFGAVIYDGVITSTKKSLLQSASTLAITEMLERAIMCLTQLRDGVCLSPECALIHVPTEPVPGEHTINVLAGLDPTKFKTLQ
ncbi:MAG: hypothetical protein KBC16_01605 [Candidatus Pacebacteria bacterium]|nr:hypothetical protein [Candidatus Paceibacterota bacterium]